jgi:putative tryptophan/tyrosine transport system substrate-binding protein
MAYSVDFVEMLRHAAVLVDKIIKGQSPTSNPLNSRPRNLSSILAPISARTDYTANASRQRRQGDRMKRRELLAALGSIALAASMAAAQNFSKVLRIAFIGSGQENGRYVASFRDALHSLGYIEGQNIQIEYRWAEGKFDLLPGLISNLVAKEPDVIVSFGGGQLTRTLKSATSTVPVVFLTGDPVAEGIVASLARPGGNLTGVAVLAMELDTKRMELVKEVLPHAMRIAVLRNPDYSRAKDQLENVVAAARVLGLEVGLGEARSSGELEGAFTALSRVQADALLVLSDPMLNSQSARIVDFAASNHLPGFYFWRQFVDLGGLISYGASLDDMLRRMGFYVDRILRGAKPSELAIEQPTRFELVINLKTARALGLSIPSSLLAHADEVIE